MLHEPICDIEYDMRLVLDTDVVLSGLRSPDGASRILLIAAWEGIIQPLASVATMVEYEAVLKRPEHLNQMGLDANDVEVFLDGFAAICEAVTPHFRYRPSIRDPDDEIFVDVVLNGAAEALVTFNVKDYRSSVTAEEGPGIHAIRPGDVLRRIQWRPSPATLSGFRPRS
ncbi:PIN domain-containing protein [Aliidongia dinghuensis]|uniref:PIN domain-containing protein n=1 Tax=Aliidongia dinghuensis TaxID=1867774 RepID=A0A8J2YY95_9PROT|nr:putative toxin-antitoxin system toxin component, PIN family [Aliidongia dinghuensis]GGF39903.1 PIN domain-containing protein [Aliidongia dinghuensis]